MAAFAPRLSVISGIILVGMVAALGTAPQRAAGTSLVVNRMLTVAATGPATENCQALLDTLASITDAAESKRYVIRLEPGTYDCGATEVGMKSWVDLAGSGREVTLLTSQSGSATLRGKANSEVRHLTVENRGGIASPTGVVNEESARFSHVTVRAHSGSVTVIGMVNGGGANPVLTALEIEVDGDGSLNAFGLVNSSAAPSLSGLRIEVEGGGGSYGIFNQFADDQVPFEPTVIRETHVEVTCDGHCVGIGNAALIGAPPVEIVLSTIRVRGPADNIIGVENQHRDVIIRNSTIDSQPEPAPAPLAAGVPQPLGILNNYYGIYNLAAANPQVVQIDNSQIIGEVGTVRNTDNYTTRIGGSLLAGGDADITGGTLICAGVWDEAGVFHASDCPLDTPPP